MSTSKPHSMFDVEAGKAVGDYRTGSDREARGLLIEACFEIERLKRANDEHRTGWENCTDRESRLLEQYEDAIKQRDLAMKANHDSLVAHAVEKQAKHNAEAELRGVKEQLQTAQKYEATEQALAAQMRQERDEALELLQRAEEQLDAERRELGFARKALRNCRKAHLAAEAALKGVAWKDSDGLCWCPGETEFAVAHPNGEHTPRCLAARAALSSEGQATSPGSPSSADALTRTGTRLPDSEDGSPIEGRPGWFWSASEGRPIWRGDD